MLIKNQTYSPYQPELGLIRAEQAQTGRKRGFQEPGVE